MASQDEHDHECEGGVCIRKVLPVVGNEKKESETVEVVKKESKETPSKVEPSVVVKDVHVDESSSIKQVVFSSESESSGHGHSHGHGGRCEHHDH